MTDEELQIVYSGLATILAVCNLVDKDQTVVDRRLIDIMGMAAMKAQICILGEKQRRRFEKEEKSDK